jgi:hypothetical protein
VGVSLHAKAPLGLIVGLLFDAFGEEYANVQPADSI